MMNESLQKRVSHLRPFEKKLVTDAIVLSDSGRKTPDPEYDSLIAVIKSGCNAETSLVDIRMQLAQFVALLTYDRFSFVFHEVYDQYSVDVAKDIAKKNVKRLRCTDPTVDDVASIAKSNQFSSAASGGSSSALVYGEVEFYAFCNLLERLDPRPGDSMYDLGSGTGKAIVAANLVFGNRLSRVSGVELLEDLNDIAQKALEKYRSILQDCDSEELFHDHRQCAMSVSSGDFLLEPFVSEWTASDIVFANSTCFDFELMKKLAAIAGDKMRSGSRFVTFTTSLPSDQFQIVEKVNLSMSWGLATCYINIKH